MILPEPGLSKHHHHHPVCVRRSVDVAHNYKKVWVVKMFAIIVMFSNCLFVAFLLTQMVAGDQVNNLRDKHSSTDGQSWPAQGGDGRVHEQSGAVQGNQPNGQRHTQSIDFQSTRNSFGKRVRSSAKSLVIDYARLSGTFVVIIFSLDFATGRIPVIEKEKFWEPEGTTKRCP